MRNKLLVFKTPLKLIKDWSFDVGRLATIAESGPLEIDRTWDSYTDDHLGLAIGWPTRRDPGELCPGNLEHYVMTSGWRVVIATS